MRVSGAMGWDLRGALTVMANLQPCYMGAIQLKMAGVMRRCFAEPATMFLLGVEVMGECSGKSTNRCL
jgi:hypothetical protein